MTRDELKEFIAACKEAKEALDSAVEVELLTQARSVLRIACIDLFDAAEAMDRCLLRLDEIDVEEFNCETLDDEIALIQQWIDDSCWSMNHLLKMIGEHYAMRYAVVSYIEPKRDWPLNPEVCLFFQDLMNYLEEREIANFRGCFFKSPIEAGGLTFRFLHNHEFFCLRIDSNGFRWGCVDYKIIKSVDDLPYFNALDRRCWPEQMRTLLRPLEDHEIIYLVSIDEEGN